MKWRELGALSIELAWETAQLTGSIGKGLSGYEGPSLTTLLCKKNISQQSSIDAIEASKQVYRPCENFPHFFLQCLTFLERSYISNLMIFFSC